MMNLEIYIAPTMGCLPAESLQLLPGEGILPASKSSRVSGNFPGTEEDRESYIVPFCGKFKNKP